MTESNGKLVWIAGLSGSGKTTLGTALYATWPQHRKCVFLDGDVLRAILGAQTGHTRPDRISLGLTYSRLSRFLCQQGIDVIVATVSMHEEVYAAVRCITGSTLVYLATPISECARRDPKRLYANYFLGEVSGVAGLDVEIDTPHNADLVVHSSLKIPAQESVSLAVSQIKRLLWESP